MTDDKKISERDAVKRERLAFARGRCMSQHEMHDDESATCTACWYRSIELYPLPKVTRPRVVRDAVGNEWGFLTDGDFALLMCKPVGHRGWTSDCGSSYPSITREIVALLADLHANPTEEVDA